MSGKKLLIYVGVLVIVAGGYFFSEYYHARQDAQQQAAKQVFTFKADDIRGVTLKSDKGEIRLERSAPATEPAPAEPPATPEAKPAKEEWLLMKPISAKTDELTMNSLLSALAELKMERQLEAVPPEQLKDFGLEKPLFQVEIEAAGQTHQLRFGHKAPGDQNIYAQKDAEPKIFLLRQTDKETLDRNLTALRRKEIFTLSPPNITEVRIVRDQGRLVLRQAEPSAWTSGEALKTQLRSDKVNALLGQIVRARAVEFVAEKADDLKKYGLAPTPAVRLTLLSGAKEETLLVGSKQGERYYAQISGANPVILVDKAVVENLPFSYDTLEERRLWPGREADVRKMIWGTPDKQVTAVREKNGWNIRTPDAKSREGAPGKVSLALWQLKELEFSKLLPPTEAEPSTPLFVLELFGPEDKPLFRLEEISHGKDQAQVSYTAADKTLKAVVSAKALAEMRQHLERLADQEAKP